MLKLKLKIIKNLCIFKRIKLTVQESNYILLYKSYFLIIIRNRFYIKTKMRLIGSGPWGGKSEKRD